MVQPYLAVQAEALGEMLAAAAPGHPRRCVFASSGAEAVEAALKLVRARTGRSLVLAATGAYHGKTLGALSLTARVEHAEGFGPLAPGFDQVPFGDAEALEARLARAPGPFAALFLEPIQGEGGVIVPPPGYLARARELCSRHGVALVLDEIQTGLGRTGRMFACEEEGVVPDLLLVGKGLGGGLFPLAACLVADGWWDERFALGHSSTFANNNVACAVGMAVLRELAGDRDRPGLVAQAAARGERLGAGLRRLAARYPRVVAAARGRGLLWALELAAGRRGAELAARIPPAPGALRLRRGDGARAAELGAGVADAGDGQRAAHRAAAGGVGRADRSHRRRHRVDVRQARAQSLRDRRQEPRLAAIGSG